MKAGMKIENKAQNFMKHSFPNWPIVFVTAVLLALVPFSNAQSADSARAAAVIVSIEGKVEVSRAGQATWQAAQTNMLLQVGDRIRTGIRSRAMVRLSNQSVMRINELTVIMLPAPPAGARNSIELQNGSTYLFSRDPANQTQFRTPVASGAIRGTEFHLAVGPDGATDLALLDGEVDLGNQFGQVVLKSGEQGTVKPGQAPAKTALVEAINIIQWCLYYPAILDISELPLPAGDQAALAASLSAYKSGDLLQANSAYPEGRVPASDAERIYHAALLMAVGQVSQAENDLKALSAPSPLADALRQMAATVKNQEWKRAQAPALATEWLAESYYLQSRLQLSSALKAARAAVAKSPEFGFGWERVAELEFSFGHSKEAREALDKALQFSPRNAQALSLKGFLLAARNRTREALDCFEQALAVDSGLGNAWLGRGLTKIYLGRKDEGRQDIQTAAAAEPNRALLRSYLAKAYSHARDRNRAEKDLALAKKLDPNDPTAWLYSALLAQQYNQINRGVEDLEKSLDLNENRRLYRSKLLLDQDRAVRSANLALIYQDAGMSEVSVHEAGRAVSSDYANHSAHLFLANSYEALLDPRDINQRYQTPWLSELLLANLLAPPGSGTLSTYVSQQEYARLFEGNRMGFSSYTEYLSSGAWLQRASQFGTYGNFSYSLDAKYTWDPGQRPNNFYEETYNVAKIKAQVGPADTLYFQGVFRDGDQGDVAQYYRNIGSQSLWVRETRPEFYLGYRHEWAPGIQTLLFASRIDDKVTWTDYLATAFDITRTGPTVLSVNNWGNFRYRGDFHRELTAYTTELQQIWQTARHTTIAGVRFQPGSADTESSLYGLMTPVFLGPLYATATRGTTIRVNLSRLTLYAYHYWNLLDNLQLSVGLDYSRLHYPLNSEFPPIDSRQDSKDQVSPKVGLVYNPFKNTTLRGMYARSLGGVYFDTSVRLEPTQIAGFTHAYRSLIPESVMGLIPGTEFDTASLAWDQKFGRGTYMTVGADWLVSSGDRWLGVYNRDVAIAGGQAIAGSELQRLDYEEKAVNLSLNQLIGQEWSLGASYRLSDARFVSQFPGLPSISTPTQQFRSTEVNEATLQLLRLQARFHHRSGFFSYFESLMADQSNRGYEIKRATTAASYRDNWPGDNFWQFNFFAGYRFPKRQAEIRLGVLNLTDRDYQLNPLTLYNEFPRERTFMAILKLNF